MIKQLATISYWNDDPCCVVLCLAEGKVLPRSLAVVAAAADVDDVDDDVILRSWRIRLLLAPDSSEESH